MNWIFFGLISISVLTAALTGTMPKLTEASLASAKSAVELAIGLIGQMTLWLGLVGVIREAGLLRGVGNALKPVMSRLFPEVPPDHPAMGAMIMNISANVLGLGNAATPFGLKAMQELDKLNKHKGVATNSMALFLAINTSGVAVLPLGVIAVRATLGSKDPAGIIVPTLLATMCSTLFAVLVCKALEKRSMFAVERYAEVTIDESKLKAPDAASLQQAEATAAIAPKPDRLRTAIALGIVVVIVFAVIRQAMISAQACNPESWLCTGVDPTKPALGAFDITRLFFSDWLLPLLILAMVTVGLSRQVKVYETFIASAKEGFQTAIAIIPFLVGMLVAIGMFRASGAMDVLVKVLSPALTPIGFPAEAVPMALIRPLSGSGALGVMTEAIKAYGPDSFIGYLVSVLNGSTETTFYVLAVYFGAVQVKVLRHSLAACVAADFAGPLGAFIACKIFFGAAPMIMK